MQPIIASRKRQEGGFTLIEMLVVAPMIILLIGVLIGSVSVMTADALKSNTIAELTFNVNAALDQIDQDVQFSTEFRDISFTPPNAQSANGSGAPFNVITTPLPTVTHLGAVRILRSYATDKNPLDSTRNIVYSTSPNASACGTATESSNNPFQIDIVYYLKLDTVTWSYELWRRVLHNPSQTPCPGKTPWQRRSCAPGYTDTTNCRVEDEKVLGNMPLGYPMNGYYSHIPDRSWTPTAPYAPIHFIDCINPCPPKEPGVNNNPSDNILDPYSRDGSGNPIQNAQQHQISLYAAKTVAGETVAYGNTKYSRRLNSPLQ